MTKSDYAIEIDKATEEQWSELLDRFADGSIYQTWSYGTVRWGERNLSHVVLKKDGEVVAIAQLRIIRPANLKVGVAYLRWGPLTELRGKSPDPDVVRTMASVLREEYGRKRGLYLEILPNAFSGTSRAEAFQSAFSQYQCNVRLNSGSYRTLVLDLEPPIEELRKNLDKKWRNQLNAGERNNLSVIAGEGMEEYRSFCDLYSQMWERKRFKTNVSVEEFGQIQERLPEKQRMRVMICSHEGQALAGVVCTAMGDSAIYLLGATNEAGMKLKAAYVLHWTVIRWLKERGIRYYDLGGIDPEANPGVYHFKRGLSGADLSHISPLTTCDNFVSLALIKTGNAVRNRWKTLQTTQEQV